MLFWPCLKVETPQFFLSTSLYSVILWSSDQYRCIKNHLFQICCYSDMEHIFGRPAQRSFCSPYRSKNNSPIRMNQIAKSEHLFNGTLSLYSRNLLCSSICKHFRVGFQPYNGCRLFIWGEKHWDLGARIFQA